MRYFKLIFILIICITCLSACKKVEIIHPSDLTLPDITNEGKGTFGCILNGEVWAANRPPCTLFQYCPDNPLLRRDDEIRLFTENSYDGSDNDSKNEILGFTINSNSNFFYELGRYYFSDTLYFDFADRINDFYVSSYDIEEDTYPDTLFGYVEFTRIPNFASHPIYGKDSIASGTFDFTFIKGADTFEFKHGRFDVLLDSF